MSSLFLKIGYAGGEGELLVAKGLSHGLQQGDVSKARLPWQQVGDFLSLM